MTAVTAERADAPTAVPAAPAEAANEPQAAAVAPKEPATAVALREVANNLAEFDTVEAGLQDLEAKHGGVIFDVQTPKGLKAAKEARMACRDPRYAVQNAVKNAKVPLNNLKAAIAARGEAIIARITAVEDPIDAQVKAEEKRLADEKARLEREAAERKAEIDTAIAEITGRVEACIDQSPGFIAETLEWLDATEVNEEDFGDRTEEARNALTLTRERLLGMKAAAEARELALALAKVEADRLKAQADALAEREAAITKREKIGERIELIYTLPDSMVEADSGVLRSAIASLDPLDPEVYGARLREAQRAADAVLPELRALLSAAEAEENAEPEPQEPEPQEAPPAPTLTSSSGEPVEAIPAPVAATPVAAPAAVAAPVVVPGHLKSLRPSDSEIFEVLAKHYRVTEATVVEWLMHIDLLTASQRLADADVPF